MNTSLKMLLLSMTILVSAGMGKAIAADAAAGKAKAATCVSCHGANGISIAPNYPNLACQKEKYLVKAIKEYKNGDRKDPMMKPMVMSLSDTDIENVAAFFSTLNCP